VIASLLMEGLIGLYIHDRWISKDNILRNFPVVGRFRSSLIELGPKLRQYIIADNNEELPFNRDEREWIYRSADGENNYFGFGTDDQIPRSAASRRSAAIPGSARRGLPRTTRV
jgi:hypothetical protein